MSIEKTVKVTAGMVLCLKSLFPGPVFSFILGRLATLATLFFAFSPTAASAYDIVSPGGFAIAEPYKTITTEATSVISGDTASFTSSGSTAFAVGDRIVVSLSGGATFADNAYSLESSRGGAGDGNLTYAVLQTATPNGSSTLTFTMRESTGGSSPPALSAILIFILSGNTFAGQSIHVNLPRIAGRDIYMTFTLYDSGGNLKGTTNHVFFHNSLATEVSTAVPASLNAIVSQSQAGVMAKNIGGRFNAILKPSAGGIAPQNRPAPNAFNATEPSHPDDFDGYGDRLKAGRPPEQANDDKPFRTFAMAATFDTSQMILAAASDNTGPDGPVGTSRLDGLLLDRPWTVWGQGSYTHVDNDRNKSDDDSRFHGNVWGYNLGVDYRFRENLYAGASLGYSKTNLTTQYNSGTYDEATWSLSPYFIFKPTSPLEVSGILGYSVGKIDQTRSNSLINSLVESETDSRLIYTKLNVAYTVKPQEHIPLELSAKVGFLGSYRRVDAFRESDGTEVAAASSKTAQIAPGLKAAYGVDVDGTTVKPFIKTSYVYDFLDLTNGDDDAIDVGGGIHISSGTTGFSGAFEGETRLGRDDYQECTITGLLAYSFTIGEEEGRSASIVEPYVKTDFGITSRLYTLGANYRHRDYLSVNLYISQTDVVRAEAEKNTKVMLKSRLRF